MVTRNNQTQTTICLKHVLQPFYLRAADGVVAGAGEGGGEEGEEEAGGQGGGQGHGHAQGHGPSLPLSGARRLRSLSDGYHL